MLLKDESPSHSVYTLIIETTHFNMWNIVLQLRMSCTKQSGPLKQSGHVSNKFVRFFFSLFRNLFKRSILRLIESIYDEILSSNYSLKKDSFFSTEARVIWLVSPLNSKCDSFGVGRFMPKDRKENTILLIYRWVHYPISDIMFI